MAEFHFTPDQRLAIGTRGRSLLVSAAAGSGKTRVLVSRLLSYITDPDDPKDIDSFLIITYTKAAAAELRSRILRELGDAAAARPESRRLRRQASLCARAQIGTIHSFCTAVLRENCHRLGLAPDFRVADTDRAALLKRSALERLLEERYAHIDTDEDFRSLSDTVGAGRDDRRLSELVIELHEKMQCHPYPAAWAAEQAAALNTEGVSDVSQTIWGRELMEAGRKKAAYWAGALDDLLEELHADEAENAPMIKAYGASLAETAEAARALVRAFDNGWEAVRGQFPLPFPRLGPLRNFPNEALTNRVKSRRDSAKKAFSALAEAFCDPSEQLLREIETVRPAMRALLELTLELDRAFTAEKRRASLVDFSDLEHLAVQLLVDPDTLGPTAVARELSGRYTEIMVDEYQDVNAVQDLLFRAISRDGKNIFAVGDVKQSIYRFRLADPTIFIRRFLSSADAANAAPGADARVLLRENFRSRACVLEAANHVFSNIMSQELGEMDYDDRARLRVGAAYPPEGETPVELNIVAVPATEGEDESPDKVRLEAAFVARRIQRLVEAGTPVAAGAGTRPMDYGDIVILLRSPGSAGEAYRAALTARGIPVAAEQGGDFFTSLEVSVALSLLAITDNPHQDVPLISVLRSPLFGFTGDDLARIRAADREADFYTALTKAAADMPACAAFLETLDSFRALAPEMPTDELLAHIYDRTDMEALCEAMADGSRRSDNLNTLLQYARKFESGGYRGLFRFVAYMKRLMESGAAPQGAVGEGGSAVRIMSIHRSKGLEFPVVFLADTARKFNRQDLSRAVLMHPRLGLGPKLTDLQRGVEYPTLCRRAVSECQTREALSEEMRVLYVAMTRAKERLIISCALKEPEKTLEKLSASLASPLPPQVLSEADSMAMWLLQCALLDDETLFRLRVHTGEDEDLPEAASGEEGVFAPLAAKEFDLSLLDYVYPHAQAAALPSKLTATELKGLLRDAGHDPESGKLETEGSRGFTFRRPDFARAAQPPTGVEAGTAIHAVLQHLDFSKTGSRVSLAEEVARIHAMGWLDDETAPAVDTGILLEFFRSPLGIRLCAAETVYRELRFSLLTAADRFLPTECSEPLLTQGIVDCCFVEDGQLVLLDYKTDRVWGEAVLPRAEGYRIQLQVYADSLSRMLGLPVKEAWLYFLRPGQAVKVEMD